MLTNHTSIKMARRFRAYKPYCTDIRSQKERIIGLNLQIAETRLILVTGCHARSVLSFHTHG